jgi:hypothetical protein
MKIKLVLFTLLVFVVSTAFVMAGNEKVKELNLSADGIETLDAETGSGYLKIKGVTGLEKIEVKATIQTKGVDEDDMDHFIKKHVRLSLKKQGSKAVLYCKIESSIVSSIFNTRNVVVNLDVQVPKKMDLDVDDGSGLIEIENLKGTIELEDGSGSITLEDIDGNVDIDDNSGPIEVYNISGSVVVEDGSGGILIDGVDKDVHIKRAGSGGVTIRNVKGTVER